MIYKEVIEHMDYVELRDYVTYLIGVLDAQGDLLYSKNKVIEDFYKLNFDIKIQDEEKVKRDNVFDRLRAYEDGLLSKYKDVISKPMPCKGV